MATTTSRLGLKVIDTPAVDTVDQLRLSINNHASILDAQYIESTYASRPAAASKGRVHRSTDTGEIAVDTGTVWEPIWGTPSLSRSVLDVGQVGQTKAGRPLAWDDFWDLCGLGTLPVAIFNGGSLSDVSGNGRNLTNKGSVSLTGVGIEGATNTASQFAGSSTQSLYRDDTGSNDPFRLRTGSWGCWHKTGSRVADQSPISKWRSTGNLRAYRTLIKGTTGFASTTISIDGTNNTGQWAEATGITNLADDKWHFIVGTYDGAAVKLYVDGQLEATAYVANTGPIASNAAPFNIGSTEADSVTAAVAPSYGRVGPAFVCPEVLTADMVRILYGVRLTHGLTSTGPRRTSLRVSRRRIGGTLANSDFPATPLRAFNLNGLTYTDLNGGTAVAPVGGGTLTAIAGPSGAASEAINFAGAHTGLGSTDSGFPSGTTDRSYGCWFNTASLPAAVQQLLAWGTNTTAHASLYIEASTGKLRSDSGADAMTGPVVTDGKWHHAAVVETNTPLDGVKRKLYLDGVMVASSTTLNSITLAGANAFRIGASLSGGGPISGAISRAFVAAAAYSAEQVDKIRMKSIAGIPASPKDAGDNVEVFGSGNAAADLVFIGSDLEPQWTIDLEVSR